MINIGSTQSMFLVTMAGGLLIVCPLMSDLLRERFHDFWNPVVNIIILMYINMVLSSIIFQILYLLSWIYGEYNFTFPSVFEIVMMINSRFSEVFVSRLKLSWNGVIWNGLSHVQWALSLVVVVRRSDFNLAWNGQEWLSFITSTTSFVLVWVFCYDSVMVFNMLFHFIVLLFIVIGICLVIIHLYHDDYHDMRLKYKYFLSMIAISILLRFEKLHIMTIISHYYQYFTSFKIFCVYFLSMVCLIICLVVFLS